MTKVKHTRTIWPRVRGELEVQKHETQTFCCATARNKSQDSAERCLRAIKCNAAIIYVRCGAVANMEVDTENLKSGIQEQN